MAETIGNDPVATPLAGLPVPQPDTIYVLRQEHPQIQVTWGSKFPAKVDKLKLRKQVKVFPVKFTLKADYDTNTREFEYGCRAQDAMFGGDISINIPEQSLEYRKRVSLPNGTRMMFAGSCSYRENRFQPNFGVALEFGGETHSSGVHGESSAVYAGNHFDVRQRFNVVRGLAMEICGGVSLPAPAARYTHNSGTLALGEGAFHLHVAEINAVLRI